MLRRARRPRVGAQQVAEAVGQAQRIDRPGARAGGAREGRRLRVVAHEPGDHGGEVGAVPVAVDDRPRRSRCRRKGRSGGRTPRGGCASARGPQSARPARRGESGRPPPRPRRRPGRRPAAPARAAPRAAPPGPPAPAGGRARGGGGRPGRPRRSPAPPGQGHDRSSCGVGGGGGGERGVRPVELALVGGPGGLGEERHALEPEAEGLPVDEPDHPQGDQRVL